MPCHSIVMWMENDTFSAPLDMGGRNSNVMDETPLHPTPNSLVQCDSFDLNHQTAGGISMLVGVQGEPISNVDANVHLIDPSSVVHSNLLDSCEFQVQTAGGMPITPASLDPKFGFDGNLEKSPALPPLEALGPYIFENWQDSSNHFLGDNSCHEIPGNANEFPKAPEVDGTGFQSHLSTANLDSNGWASPNVANLTTWSNFSNELVLSLATSPTVGECSEVNCSDFTHCLNKTRSLSMSLNSNKHVHFSQAILGSRYLIGIQEILAQMARYSLENLEQINCSSNDIRAGGNAVTSVFPPKRGIAMGHNANSKFEVHTEAPLQRHAAESNKTELLTLVQLVDNRYSQCLNEIHTVVSAFHAATELDPQVHAHFALQTISLLYKDLRDRICNYILAMGATFNNPCTEDIERSVQTSFIQKQWALQQLKRTDHQLWRPQRGLPEKSVCVLRSWMFQNFLHPYPKDAEKHLLAVKSGLTRSQVSNWFINARVRLWKPMIEEMYAEMNKRKACRNERGTESSHRSRLSMSNQNFNMR